MENETFLQKTKRVTRKVMRWTLGIILFLVVVTFSFLYWGTYEKGVMAGKVIRVTEKGIIFKTYEGKLNLETFGALKGASPVAESFDFSVETGDEEVIKALQDVSLSGERVNLHFVKRYMIFFWRGDTRYFITEVERAPH